MRFLEPLSGTAIALALYIQPKSSKNAVCGRRGDELKIALTAPPVDGKANKAAIAFLAELFGVSKSSVTIISGLQSRHKRCRIEGVGPAEAKKIISTAIPPDQGER